MFHNIFSSESKKENPNKIKPKIIADIHEKNSLILAELKYNKDICLIIQSLEIGDYLIGQTIIERKTISDFISSIISKRLIQQLNQMQKYKQRLLIIEGNLKEINNFRTPNALRGMILSIINNQQTPIIFTQNEQETSQYLTTLAKQQLKKPQEITLHSKIPKTTPEQKKYILESFPNIGPITAKRLLDKFQTITNVINAKENELKEVLGIKYDSFKELISK